MEEIELHPINTRVVCLNQPHLRPMWVFKALAAKLGYYYNNHLLQVISSKASIQLPNSKTVKLKGHTSHRYPTEAATLNTTLEMGTYVMFYVPDSIVNDMQTSYLILNGIESITKAGNPSQATVQIMKEGVVEDAIESDISALYIPNNESHKIPNESKVYIKQCSMKSLDVEFDFSNCERIETLVEEEENIDSGDDSDCLEDVHMIVRHRLAINISSLIDKWRDKQKNNVCVFLIKPAQECQSWQFKSVWITTILHCNKENLGSTEVPRKTKITRKKPVSFLDSLGTINTKRKQNSKDKEESTKLIQLQKEAEISVF